MAILKPSSSSQNVVVRSKEHTHRWVLKLFVQWKLRDLYFTFLKGVSVVKTRMNNSKHIAKSSENFKFHSLTPFFHFYELSFSVFELLGISWASVLQWGTQFSSFKVHIFWECHKILRNLNLTFVYSTVHTDKSKVEISQNFVAFSEYMENTRKQSILLYF